MDPNHNRKLYQLRDEFVYKSSRVYVMFYISWALATMLSVAAGVLIYEEQNFPSSASSLDIAATVCTALSTLILSIIAHSNMKGIAESMNEIGKLLNLYLSPFISNEDRMQLQKQIYTKSMELNTFWVTLPTVEFEVADQVLGNAFDENVVIQSKRLHGLAKGSNCTTTTTCVLHK